MHAQSGHPIQERISKYLKQYKEEQPDLLRTITPIFSSVTAMMQDLEWPTLEERRWVTKVTSYVVQNFK